MDINIHTLKFYWQQSRLHKVSFFLALTCIPLYALMIDTVLAFYLSQSIGEMAKNNQQGVVAALQYASMAAVAGIILNFIGFRALAWHETIVQEKLSNETFRQLLEKDYSFYVNEKIGALTSRYIDFIRSQSTLQDLLVMQTLSFVLSVFVGLVIVALQAPLLASVIGFLIIIILIEVKVVMKIRKPYRHKRKTMKGEIHGKAADTITNSSIVKIFAQEQNEANEFARITNEFKNVSMKDYRILMNEGTLRNALMALTTITGTAIAAYLVLHQLLELGLAIFTLAYLQRIASQLFNLSSILFGYDQALLDAAPMTDYLLRENKITDRLDATELTVTKGEIRAEDLSYSYNNTAKDVIDAMNFHIRPGEKVGIVGFSGAGKTTLTSLLLRLDDSTSGSISIDGQNIKDVTQKSLRDAIAYVPQEPTLFHRTLRENIAYGNPREKEEQIIQAAKKAHAWEFIADLPNGMDTLVGERGIKLSGGQRQRIAIARAILKDAPILILDEATSALDSESEQLIQDALKKLMKNRTTIVIAHRLSTIAHLDRIIVLNKGQIAENGTHKELLAQNGIYTSLWSHQSGGFIED